MKKFILTFSLLGLVLAGTGCFWSDEETQESEQQLIYEKHAGVLKKITDKDAPKKATHVLEKEGGDNLFVYSIFYDLDSKKYLDKKLEVRGVLVKDKEKMLEIEDIKVLEEETKEEGLWSEYKNKNLGILIQYKNTLAPKESKDEISFEAKDEKIKADQLIYIKLFANDNRLTLATFLRQNNKDVPATKYAVSEIGKDKIKALKYLSSDSTEVIFYVSRDKYVYEIGHKSKDEKTQDEYRNTFYEMLSSFQYTAIEESGEAEKEDEKKAEEGGTEDESEDLSKDKEESKDEIKADEKAEEGVKEEPAEEENKEEPEEEVEEEKTGESETTLAENDISEEYALVSGYIKTNITSLAPEPEALGGTWYVTKFEFTDSNYVYVEYEDGHDRRKILVKYALSGDKVQTEVLAYFKPGEAKDWEIEEGENVAAGQSKEVLSVDSSGQVQTDISVQEGYRYFESAPYGFKMQFPTDWYYSGGQGHYSFSDAPVDEENEIVGLDILGESLSTAGGEITTLGGKKAVILTEGDNCVIYVERSSGGSYKLTAPVSYKATLEFMGESIVD